MATSRKQTAPDPEPLVGPVVDEPDAPAAADVVDEIDATGEPSDVESVVEELPAGEDATEPAPARPAPFMSEGIRQDLELTGKATDPVTGGVFTRDEQSGAVSFTDRSGTVTEL